MLLMCASGYLSDNDTEVSSPFVTDCVQCTHSAHCPSRNPYCDLNTLTCIECFDDYDCGHNYGAFCDHAAGFQCRCDIGYFGTYFPDSDRPGFCVG